MKTQLEPKIVIVVVRTVISSVAVVRKWEDFQKWQNFQNAHFWKFCKGFKAKWKKMADLKHGKYDSDDGASACTLSIQKPS